METKRNSMDPIISKLKAKFFIHFSQKPLKHGYDDYKKKYISETLQNFDLKLNSLPPNFGNLLDERVIEYPWVLKNLPTKTGRLFDAGSALNFNYILKLPQLREKKIYISTLEPENNFYKNKNISYVFQDLRETCFKNDFFDWITCISTLEHISMDNSIHYTKGNPNSEPSKGNCLTAIIEFNRILKPRGSLFITLPFGKNTNLKWLQVFDENMVDSVISQFSPSRFEEAYFTYKGGQWINANKSTLSNSKYFEWHNRQYVKGAPAAAESIVCLKLIK